MNDDIRLTVIGLWAECAVGERTLANFVSALNHVDDSSAEDQVHTALNRVGSRSRSALEEALAEGLEHWQAIGVRSLEAHQTLTAGIVTLADSQYPQLLRDADGPPVLAVRGDISVLAERQVAVVGTRRMSKQSGPFAGRIANQLAERGIVITSGGAYGVDAAAHRGALKAEAGKTVVVLGTAHDRVYPARHVELFASAAERGAVVSQFPLGMERIRGQFPRRNAVIAGLARSTLVVQAPASSGALHTARSARRCGRPVFILPGTPLEPNFEGGYRLVETGQARILRTLEQLYRADAPADAPTDASGTEPTSDQHGLPWEEPPALTGLAAQIWELLETGPASRDRLLELGDVDSTLLELELDGVVEQLAGARYRRARHFGGAFL